MNGVQCDTFGQGRVAGCSELESVIDRHRREGNIYIQDLAFELTPGELQTGVLGEDDVTAESLPEKFCTIFADNIVQVDGPSCWPLRQRWSAVVSHVS